MSVVVRRPFCSLETQQFNRPVGSGLAPPLQSSPSRLPMWRKVLIILMSSAVPVSPSDTVFSQARRHIHWTLSGRYHSLFHGSLHFNLRGSSRASGRQFRFGQREDRSLTLGLIYTPLEECGLKEKERKKTKHCAFGHVAEVVWEHSHSKSGPFADLRFDSLLVDNNSCVLPASTEGAAALTPVGRNRRELDVAFASPRRCEVWELCLVVRKQFFLVVFWGRGREIALLGL